MFTDLLDAFQYQFRQRPESPALIVPRPESGRELESISWRRLAATVAVVAGNLRSALAAESSSAWRVGHASDNTLSDVVIALAAMVIGAVEVPIDHRLQESEVESRWNRVGGYWLDPRHRVDMVWEALDNSIDASRTIDWNQLCQRRNDIDQASLVLWTSGTTGRPQGVTLSQRNLFGNAAAKLGAVGQRRDDVRLCVLPLSHAYARTCDFGTWLLSGCTMALTIGFDGWRRLGPLVRPTLANTVPSLASRLLDGDPGALGLDRLRLLGCGGAAISEQAFWRWSERGVTVIQGYGLTESSPVICSATPDDARPGLVGRLVDGWEHDIRDGQLFVRGAHNMIGYWDDAAATANKIDRQGWLDTGDLVEQDSASGQLRIVGRADDVIVLDCGRKLNPCPIEQALEQIVGVRHAILIGTENGLELWLDQERHDAQVAEDVWVVFHDRPGWQHPRAVRQFDPVLSRAAGELTDKGTVRRKRVMETRFRARPRHQAGS